MATNLTAGSMAIIGFNGTDPDDFSFVLLTAVEAGTVIYFTDAGVQSGNGAFADDTEGVMSWTASVAYPAGTVINSVIDAGEFSTVANSTLPNLFGFDLSDAGDQLFAFQAGIDPVTGEFVDTSFLFALQSNSTAFQGTGDGQTGDPADPNQSALPAGLIEGQTALALGSGPGDEDFVANLVYSGPTTGTAAELLAAIANPANWTDSASALTQITANFTVNGTAPVITTVGSLVTPEDTALDITGVSVADAENDLLTVTLAASSTATVVATGTAVITGNGTALVTIQGTPAEVNVALATISYDPTLDFNGTGTIDITADDGSGGLDLETLSIDVTAVNDAPILSALDAAVGFTGLQMLAGPQIIYAAPNVSDVDSPDLDTGVLTVSYAAGSPGTADDQLSIASAVAPGAIEIVGSNIFINEDIGNNIPPIFNQILVGTFAGGVNGADLVITLNASATPAVANTILNSLQYQNTNGAPSGSRDITVSLSDGDGGTSAISTTTIDITNPNAAPTLADLEPALLLDPGDVILAPQPVDANVTLTDGDSADLDGGNLTITYSAGFPGNAEDQLSFASGGSIVIAGSNVSFNGNQIGTITSDGANGADLVVDFAGVNATPAAVDALIEALLFQNSAAAPSGVRELSITVDDGDGGISAAQTIAINISTPPPPDDGKVNYTENDPATIIDEGATIIVADPVITFDGATLTVSIAGGDSGEDVLSIANTGNVFLSDDGFGNFTVFVDGNQIGVVTGGTGGNPLVVSFPVPFGIVPTTDQVQAVARAVSYENSDGDDPTGGDRTITMTLLEAGQTPQDLGLFTVEVTPVEDPPVISDLVASVSFDNAVVTANPQDIDTDVTLTDDDTTTFDGGSLTVTNSAGVGLAGDQLSIRDDGGAGIDVTGTTVSFNSLVIGTISGGANGADLVVDLTTTDATLAAVEALIEAIQYQNTDLTPAASRVFNVIVNDGEGGTSTGNPITVNITGAGANQPPVLGDVATTVSFNTSDLLAAPQTIDADVTVTDVDSADFDGGSLSLSYDAPPVSPTNQLSIADSGTSGVGIEVSDTAVSFNGVQFGTISSDGVNGNNLVVVFSNAATPAAVEALAEALQYQNTSASPPPEVNLVLGLTDGDGGTATPVNIALEIVDDSAGTAAAVADLASTDEDNAVTIPFATLLANDTGFGAGLNIQSVQNAVNGAVVIVGTDVVFTPNADYNGPAFFNYTASDGVFTSSASVTVAVSPVNDAPVAVDDNAGSTDEDTAITITAASLLANDTDVDGDTLNLVSVQSAVNGTVTLDGEGNAVFTPNADFNGPASFAYTASDGALTSTATVNLTVNPLVDIADDSDITDEDNAVIIDVLANDTFEDAGAFVSAVTNGADGSVAIGPGGAVTYTPNADFNGNDSFTYTVTAGGVTETANVNVTVNPVNDAPIAVDDAITAVEDTLFTSTIDLDANDTDVDGDLLSVVAGTFATAQGGSLVLAADGSYTYTPALNFNGLDSVDYTVTDGTLTDVGTLNITVTPVNDAPVAVDDGPFTGTQFHLVGISAALLLANDTDADGDPLSVVSVQAGVNGDAFIGVDGNIYFDPDDDFTGPASFTYTASDGVLTSTATVSLQIDPAIGDNTFIGGPGKDNFGGTAGVDIVIGNAGNDRLSGKADNDIISGGLGDDVIKGGADDDYLIGGAGDDELTGGGSDDILEGGSGNDELLGGGGNDLFIFRPGFGNDEIKFFQDGAGTADVIEFQGFGNLDFATVIANATQSGNTTVLNINGDSISLKFVDISVLHPDDFNFGPSGATVSDFYDTGAQPFTSNAPPTGGPNAGNPVFTDGSDTGNSVFTDGMDSDKFVFDDGFDTDANLDGGDFLF